MYEKEMEKPPEPKGIIFKPEWHEDFEEIFQARGFSKKLSY